MYIIMFIYRVCIETYIDLGMSFENLKIIYVFSSINVYNISKV